MASLRFPVRIGFTRPKDLIFSILVLLLIVGCSAKSVLADSDHARIVRLSLVQGDVRFARDVKGDPLADAHGAWEQAVLNLPIRQGYVVATDSGRAAVEFENGATAYLAENTVLEFYDLSSEDGGFTTRLILRQGSAEFYVNPARGDYFSVTGGDFSVQAETRSAFRMNNFDDGSSVSVLRGRLTALTDGKNTPLQKGQSLSVQAGEPDSLEVERAPASDEFDHWASGQFDSVSAATTAAAQYFNSNAYSSGYGDLYTYGSWTLLAGYGNVWQPYGVGFGWSPFDFGSWYYDPVFGWSFLGGQPWGWLPYHYGGWLFRPGVGWVWSPTGSIGGVGRWRPVTGVFMRSSSGALAIVPSNPMDVKGKPPLNLSAGLFAVTERGVSQQLNADGGDQWKVEKKPASDLMQNQLAAVAAPAHVARKMATVSTAAPRTATTEHESTIVFDPAERRFVNSNKAQPASAAEQTQLEDGKAPAANAAVENERATPAPAVPSARAVPPPRASIVPPSVPRSVTAERSFHEGGSSGSGTSRGTGAGNSTAPATTMSPASTSTGARSSGGGGGGRPH